MIEKVPFFKALADPSRVRIFDVLHLGTFNVGEICKILELGQSRTSRHLKILAEAQLIEARREGTWVYYSLPSPRSIAPEALPFFDWYQGLNQVPAEDQIRARRCLEERKLVRDQYFERVAPEWMELRRQVFGDLNLLELGSDFLSDCKVLADLGCGTGDFLFESPGQQARRIGVDRSKKMLRQARKRQVDEERDDLDFRQGDLEDLPLKDGEVDGALVHMVLHYLPRPPDAFPEISRVLSPGGRFLLVDYLPHQEDWMREEHNHQWLGFEPSDLEAWARRAGLTEVSTKTLPNSKGGPDLVLLSGSRPNQ